MEAIAAIFGWTMWIIIMLCFAALCVSSSVWLVSRIWDSIMDSNLWKSIARTIINRQEEEQDE